MQNPSFVKLNAINGEQFFRKDNIKHFGFRDATKSTTSHSEVSIVMQTSERTSVSYGFAIDSIKDYEDFRDQMLDMPAACTEELGKTRNSPLHADAPEKPEEEPAFVTRDCLEITEGAEEFFKWLHGKFYNSEKIGCWSFQAVPGTQDEDFIVCHKPNTSTSPADVHIAFRNHFTYARVCGIVVNDHYTPDYVGFNSILHEFVRDIVKPYPGNQKIIKAYASGHALTYVYSGDRKD